MSEPPAGPAPAPSSPATDPAGVAPAPVVEPGPAAAPPAAAGPEAPKVVGPGASVADRLYQWSRERFPLGPMAVFSGVTAASAAAAVAAFSGAPVLLDARLLSAWSGHLLTLLFLRLLDEQKDHAKDVVAYPERALSRGVVTLPLLGQVAIVVGVLALFQSAGLGLLALLAYGVVLAFALLMSKEFFVGAALEKDVFLYAAVHQPINPLITAWLLIGLGHPVEVDPAEGPALLEKLRVLLPAAALPYLAAQACLGFGFEIARKVWTPAEERPDLVQSYSAHPIGPRGAAWLALALLLAGLAFTVLFARQQGLPAWLLAPVGVCALLCITTVGKFAVTPFPGASKKLQGAVGLGSLVLHVGIVAAVIARRGVLLSLWPGAGS